VVPEADAGHADGLSRFTGLLELYRADGCLSLMTLEPRARGCRRNPIPFSHELPEVERRRSDRKNLRAIRGQLDQWIANLLTSGYILS